MSIDLHEQDTTLAELVLAFFRIHPDEAEVVENPVRGVADIYLRGNLAGIFHGLAEDSDDPTRTGQKQLRLLLDPKFAAAARGYEAIVPRSRLVRIIENRLAEGESEGESVRHSRAMAMVNTDGTFDDLAQLGVAIRHAETPSAQAEYCPHQYYAVSYRFSQSAYERNEETLRVYLDAQSLEVLPAERVALFANLALVDPNEVTGQPTLPPLTRSDLKAILTKAQQAATERVKSVIHLRVGEKSRDYLAELNQLELHHRAEMRSTRSKMRQQLMEENFQAAKAKLEEVYKVSSTLSLLSVLELQIPTITFHTTLKPAGGGNPVTIPFVFDPLGNTVRTPPCPRCKCDNKKELCLCGRGGHLECAACDTIRKCSADGCEAAACPDHAVHCAAHACSSLMCEKHERSCGYCSTLNRYCATHIGQSVEQKDICPTCASPCDECHDIYPPSGVWECGVCKTLGKPRQFCFKHRMFCEECGAPYCKIHAGPVANREGEYCLNCHARCGECSSNISHLKADLGACEDCGKLICGAHKKYCANCNSVLCADHALATVDGWGCHECYAKCRSCGGRPQKRELLLACHQCTPSESNLCCAASHASICVICHRPACSELHRVFLKEHERVAHAPACRSCAHQCSECADWFDRKQLSSCAECGEVTCQSHAALSAFHGDNYCQTHASKFVSCPGCLRQGPAKHLKECTHCGVSYCPHCNPKAVCTHCQGRKRITDWNVTATLCKTIAQASRPQKITEDEWKQVKSAFELRHSKFDWNMAQTKRHTILYANYNGGFFGGVIRLFCSVKSFLIVVDEKNIVRIVINKQHP